MGGAPGARPGLCAAKRRPRGPAAGGARFRAVCERHGGRVGRCRPAAPGAVPAAAARPSPQSPLRDAGEGDRGTRGEPGRPGMAGPARGDAVPPVGVPARRPLSHQGFPAGPVPGERLAPGIRAAHAGAVRGGAGGGSRAGVRTAGDARCRCRWGCGSSGSWARPCGGATATSSATRTGGRRSVPALRLGERRAWPPHSGPGPPRGLGLRVALLGSETPAPALVSKYFRSLARSHCKKRKKGPSAGSVLSLAAGCEGKCSQSCENIEATRSEVQGTKQQCLL